MNCCERCFKDSEITAIIAGQKIEGNCDFCKQKNVFIYDIEKNNILTQLFDGLTDIFSTEDSLTAYPKSELNSIIYFLSKSWGIFACEDTIAYELLKVICNDKYEKQPDLFDSPVGISELFDPDYLEEHSIIRTKNWDHFVGNIKHVNRFYSNYINTDILKYYLELTSKTYPKDYSFFRARICKDSSGIEKGKMGAPSKEFVTAGRANSEGIPCLYLADSPDTTLYEVRAGVYDYTTVGEFKLLEDINIVNLASIDKISPFQADEPTQFAINIECLKQIGRELAKPLRRYDSPLDYLPTQYISDFIKYLKYDGIEYISTMCPKGYNLALFDVNICECIRTEVYDIESIKYEYRTT